MPVTEASKNNDNVVLNRVSMYLLSVPLSKRYKQVRPPSLPKQRRSVKDQQVYLQDIWNSPKVMLEMPFLTLSNANRSFSERELTWKFYTAAKVLPTTKRIELIKRKNLLK